MIYFKKSKYCCEDISLIENYDKAVNERELYCIHHRLEIQGDKILGKQDLIDLDLYWNRPASELVFMSIAEHARYHNAHRSLISKLKCSETLKKNTLLGKYRH